MTYEVRVCRPEEQPEALRPIYHYFGTSPTPEGVERVSRILPTDRLHGAFEQARAVGCAAAYPLRMTVPGAQVPTAGVTMVGVLPTHRRRGILTALKRAQLDDIHERGEPVAALWASSGSLYGRFGYGMASLTGQIDLAKEYADLAAPVDPVGQVQLVSYDEALPIFPQVWDRVAPETPGMLTRSRDWWEVRRLLDLPDRREGGGEHVRAVLEVDGRPQGYALYRIHQLFERGDSAGFVNVIEAVGATPAATREIWSFLLGIDWVASVKARLLPVDHPLFLLLAHPRRMHFRVGDGVWIRLVDVGAALSARSYAAGGAVVLDVADAFCPWNEGRWKLEGGEAAKSGDEPDLRLDVTALGTVYLGGFTFAQLARAGRVEELRDGAVARADDLFRTDRAPWCPEIF